MENAKARKWRRETRREREGTKEAKDAKGSDGEREGAKEAKDAKVFFTGLFASSLLSRFRVLSESLSRLRSFRRFAFSIGTHSAWQLHRVVRGGIRS
jgi:hypothetical protein